MINYNIGILTFWNVPNYGTFAQAYALQKTIQSVCVGKDVRQIAHLDPYHYDFYFDLKSYYRKHSIWKKNFWKSFFLKNKRDIEDKKNIFQEAYDTIPHTVAIDRKNVDEICFDKIFLGSDIIWDFIEEPFNHDEMLFGGFFNATEINAYAASFGMVERNQILPDYVVRNIKKMKNISVRDKKSADIVQKIKGQRPPVVLDPVWLWNFNCDKNIQEPEKEDYILVYGQDFTDKYIKNLIDYAKENELKIIALDCNNDQYTWCDELIKQNQLNPYLWIGYFKKAKIIATSTFHGLTFGLVFKKKIAFCKTDFILAKTEAFLRQTELYDVFKNRDDVKSMLKYSWDYQKIDKILEAEKKRSLDFLKEACKENI